MWCAICNHTIAKCLCPDIDERLAELAKDPAISLAIAQNKAARQREQARKEPEKKLKKD